MLAFPLRCEFFGWIQLAQVDLALAIENVKMIQNTCGEISAPFFLPEMVRPSFPHRTVFGRRLDARDYSSSRQ